MPPPKPRGVTLNTGVASARPSPNTPMSERQQMALLIQMTATSTSDIPRTHLKKNDHKKSDDVDEIDLIEKQDENESAKERPTTNDLNTENKRDVNAEHNNASEVASSSAAKRNFSDADEDDFEDTDDVKRKKRKDSDSGKDSKVISNLRMPAKVDKNVKPATPIKNLPSVSKSSTSSERELLDSNKIPYNKSFENDNEDEDFKINDSMYSGGLKVPPLKIVIPQQNCAIDTEGNVSRTGKVTASRNAALPYVVSSSTETNERELQCVSPHESPIKINTMCAIIDEKNIKMLNEEKNLHRVLRSSHKVGNSSVERSSNNSSPQMQSSSPSPASSNVIEAIDAKTNFSNLTVSPSQQNQSFDHENITNLPSPSTSSTSSSKDIHPTVELHPRKRKLRTKNDDSHLKPHTANNANVETLTTVSDAHPHDFPFINCFQMYLNIRRQIQKKWRNMYPVKPRPPQGFHEYLLNKKTYLLSRNELNEANNIPSSIPPKLKDLYISQENERIKLSKRHTVEREKLCLNVEQEILRVHSKAARNISCQSVPYSVCTLLKDEEIYNLITPEQEEKDKNARHRFNGRLLLSWLQDVDDKWEKIKEAMVLRHHNEAESLHAVQLMDWEFALRQYELYGCRSQYNEYKNHVPIVHVSDDFDLLPA